MTASSASTPADAVVVGDEPSRSRFEVRVDGELAGFAQYERGPHEISFVHTEIDPRFAGRGLGGRLVRSALDASRASGLAVLPFCPFVRSFIEGHAAEYLDLVPEARRGRFDLPLHA